MKKLLLASAVAALSVTAAQAAPTVYGKIVVTADVVDADGSETTRAELNANGSRIGVRGGEALTANTDLVYQLEYRIRPDSNEEAQFTSRDTFIGLSNKQYGTLLAGRISAIDDMIDYADVSVGGVVGGDDLLVSFNEPRGNNTLAYVSPNYNGLQFLGMYVMDEFEVDNDNNAPGHTNVSGLEVGVDAEAYGVGFKYEPAGQPYRVGATYITTSDVGALLALGGDKATAIRVSGDYKLTPATTIAALYQNTDYGFEDKENGFTVSATHKTATPWSVYGQVDFVDNYLGADREKQRLIVGGEYAFNQATTGHIYAGYLKDKVANNDDNDQIGVGAGIEYNF